ncbi:DUF4234 domain-containing protein [Blastococcus capsensis]|uniref:DUF4234 domain-containing protein n=1 Tax=Blastococcus capsensis TaxID=1564163 RepID=UPI002541D58A|nr:DUF4234 domain-containing protein [Blastococcus capsensis]MDK3258541.1 DUF4234 domain-containing protein [Blastococcus capsensis]
MSITNEPTGQPQAAYPTPQYGQPQYGQPQYGQPQYGQPQYGQAPMGYPPAPAGHGRTLGPVGKIRSTWAVIGLSIVTFGIYGLYYYFATHEEMKQHSGEGVGGAIGLVLAIFTLGLVTPFVLPNEIGNLYAKQGRPRPVSATTGLWVLLGSFILIGPLVWLIKTNGALNAYWRSMGAS